jgi:hypothetical protein
VALQLLEDNGKSTLFCSGTFIDPDTILTAAHCAEIPPGQLQIVLFDGTVLDAVWGKISKEYDTAIIEVNYSSTNYVDVVPEDYSVALGAELVGAGYPLAERGGGFFFSEGLASLEETGAVPWAVESLTASVPVDSGYSGGGLYVHDIFGYHLVGTLQGKYTQSPYMTYWSTIEGVYNVIDE